MTTQQWPDPDICRYCGRICDEPCSAHGPQPSEIPCNRFNTQKDTPMPTPTTPPQYVVIEPHRVNSMYTIACFAETSKAASDWIASQHADRINAGLSVYVRFDIASQAEKDQLTEEFDKGYTLGLKTAKDAANVAQDSLDIETAWVEIENWGSKYNLLWPMGLGNVIKGVLRKLHAAAYRAGMDEQANIDKMLNAQVARERDGIKPERNLFGDSKDQMSQAWLAVWNLLNELHPNIFDNYKASPMPAREIALKLIREMARGVDTGGTGKKSNAISTEVLLSDIASHVERMCHAVEKLASCTAGSDVQNLLFVRNA